MLYDCFWRRVGGGAGGAHPSRLGGQILVVPLLVVFRHVVGGGLLSSVSRGAKKGGAMRWGMGSGGAAGGGQKPDARSWGWKKKIGSCDDMPPLRTSIFFGRRKKPGAPFSFLPPSRAKLSAARIRGATYYTYHTVRGHGRNRHLAVLVLE